MTSCDQQGGVLLIATSSSLALLDLARLPESAWIAATTEADGLVLPITFATGISSHPTDPRCWAVWDQTAYAMTDDGGTSWRTTPLPKMNVWPSNRMLWQPGGKYRFIPTSSSGQPAGLLSTDGGETFTVVPQTTAVRQDTDDWALLADGTLVQTEVVDDAIRMHRRTPRSDRWEVISVPTTVTANQIDLLMPWQQGLLLLINGTDGLVATFDAGKKVLPAGCSLGSRPHGLVIGDVGAFLDLDAGAIVTFQASSRRWSRVPMQVPAGTDPDTWAWHPSQPQRLWLGTSAGVACTSDGGRSWRTTVRPIVMEMNNRLVLVPATPPRVLAMTGRNLWTFDGSPAGDAQFTVPWDPVP
jgi:hypothetical protein